MNWVVATERKVGLPLMVKALRVVVVIVGLEGTNITGALDLPRRMLKGN